MAWQKIIKLLNNDYIIVITFSAGSLTLLNTSNESVFTGQE